MGTMVIAPQFEGAEQFVNGVAKVGFDYNCYHCPDGLKGLEFYFKTIKYIDRKGRYVNPPKGKP